MKFAILGAGHIANALAAAVKELDGVESYAVASRSYEKAHEFANKWDFQKAYGSYEEMLSDPDVDLVYVATPHSHHFEHAKMCLTFGKPVLVEKAFTVNATQAKELIDLAQEKKLFMAEAMWTRYMPSRKIIQDILDSGIIGTPSSLTSDFGFDLRHIERLCKPELAGGALLDLGVYPLTFALMYFPEQIKEIHSAAVLSDQGIDLKHNITLIYEDGKMADLHGNMTAVLKSQGTIYGEKGYLVVNGMNNATSISVYGIDQQLIANYPIPKQINGYEYEVLACKKSLENGWTECPDMPLSETLRVMKILDQIRTQWNMKFPCE